MNITNQIPFEWKTWVFNSFVKNSTAENVVKMLVDNGFDKLQIAKALEMGVKAKNSKDILRMNLDWQEWVATNLIQGISKEKIFNELMKHDFKDYEIINEILLAAEHPYIKASIKSATTLKKRNWLLATCDDLARLDPSYSQEVDIIETPPFSEFIKQYYSKHKPVVLKNGIKNWEALGKWTPRYFAEEFGDLEVQIQDDRETDPHFEMKSPEFRKTLKMHKFVDMIEKQGESNNYYMTGNNSPKNKDMIKEAFKDIGDFGKGYRELTDDVTSRTFFWMGPKGTYTPIHHDLTNNMLVQVHGTKKVTLIPAWQVALLYNEIHVFSEVDFQNIDLERYPLMKGITPVDVVIEEGDALFIPIGWWHCVESLSPSISVSFINFNAPNEYAATYG